MVANWPSQIKNPGSYSGLIDLSDFYATFSDILGVVDDSDGTSMMNIFSGKETVKRETATIYYDPMWGQNVSQYRNLFSQDSRYKLYQDGSFFDMENDILEKEPLENDNLTEYQKAIKEILARELDKFPKLPEKSFVR